MATNIDFNALKAQAMGAGQEAEAVTVNTRALIDKVLARYSGEWTVLRELLQNAADASSTKVIIKFETSPSSTVPFPGASGPSAVLKHTLLHHTLKRLLVTNNGQQFGTSDWSRLKCIAEGNPDETKIGAFGVGFYSVFADCEEPFVSSGNEAMAFYWKGNALFTRRLHLSEAQTSSNTTFMLDYRNTTSPVPTLLPLCQFLASSLTFVALTEIELWLDDFKLLHLTRLTAPSVAIEMPKIIDSKTTEGLMRIGSVTREMAQLEAKWLNIIAWRPSVSSPAGNQMAKGGPSTQSLRSFFSRFAPNANNATMEKAAKEERASQDAIGEDVLGESKAMIFLHVNTAVTHTKLSTSFAQELERATKKPPPKNTKIAVLTSSHDENTASISSGSGMTWKSTDIFKSVIPGKSGRIFIGFPTQQTTGFGVHISAQSLIPTVERESIDLNARWVRTWNMEILRAAGIVCRVAWSGDINSIQQKLLNDLGNPVASKKLNENVTNVLPEAIHLLNQFTFQEATPLSRVGSLVEESFWTCTRTGSIEILSSRGILPSQNVRLSTDDLSFVDGIPVLPPILVAEARGFVKKLTDFGIITEINTTDIKKELEARALTSNQLVEFLHWLGYKARIKDVDAVIVQSLLNVTVANDNDDGSQGKLIVLAETKNFINPSKIPGSVPVPPATLPFKYTKSCDRADLEALGWEDLQIIPWLRWLIENTGGHKALTTEQDLTRAPAFASEVLPILSKQWDGLSQSSKATVIELLSSRTVIPTKFGMMKPADAYFPSVKLFDDLPVIIPMQSVKEKFLTALGVRKTTELHLVFQRLMGPPEYIEDASAARPAWSHVDLIKYLASVRSDIPSSDVMSLRSAQICPAEGNSEKGIDKRYRVNELFEPDEVFRSLGLSLIQWPGVYRSGNEEGKFLTFLGLKKYPSVAELINISASAANANDLQLRDRAIKYFTDNYFQNKYAQASSVSAIPFLPLDGEDPKMVASTTQCFTNQRAAIQGFSILRKDLHPHASKFGVEINPPMLECADRLAKNPPDSKRKARELFEYLGTRINEINGRPLDVLTNAKIVPVPSKPSASSQHEKSSAMKYLPPNHCFLGTGEKYAGILDYVDFGSEANAFLLRCGSKHEPTVTEIAQLVIREPAKVFTVLESPDKYLELLSRLAEAWPVLKKDKPLVRDMKAAPFLLAYKEFPSKILTELQQGNLGDAAEGVDVEEDRSIRTYEQATASNIIIVDDVINYNLFKGSLLAAPMEEELESFYEALGATPLGSLVEQKPRIGSVINDQRDAIKLKKLIQERIKLFLHGLHRDQVKRDSTWLEKNLTITMVQSLAIRKSLRGHNVSSNQSTTAIHVKSQPGYILYITAGTRDLYHVSHSLTSLLVSRPKPEQAMMLMMFLETDLYKLRNRGYNVERILRQKAAEARVADEQRRKQMLEEEQDLRRQEATRRLNELENDTRFPNQIPMPGIFPDSPLQTQKRAIEGVEAQEPGDRRRGGFFANLTRNFVGDDRRRLPSPSSDEAKAPPPYSQQDIQRPITTSIPPQPAADSHRLQQNLLNAIKASRAYNSQSLSSDPVMNEVQETQTFCDAKPAQNISFVAESSRGVKIFLSNDLADKSKFMAENSSALELFASVLLEIAGIMALAGKSIHVFQEFGSSTIAFNKGKALFFNYSYFESLHLAAVQQGKTADAVIYWFVVLCHELAHNIVADHSSAHSFYVESFVAQYFARIAGKISGRPFSEYAKSSASYPQRSLMD